MVRTGMHLLVSFQLETGATRQVMTDDRMASAKRRGSAQIRRSVYRHNGRANRNRDMHQPTVIANQQLTTFDQGGKDAGRNLAPTAAMVTFASRSRASSPIISASPGEPKRIILASGCSTINLSNKLLYRGNAHCFQRMAGDVPG